jgi:hypothetical protein
MAKNINALPLILAGPIVRRIEPRQAAVWVALKSPAKVELSVWRGILNHNELDEESGDFIGKTEMDTVQIGERLHLATVNLSLQEPNQLQFGQLYSYNLRFTTAGNTVQDLKDLGLLNNLPGDTNGFTTISYQVDQLPGFVLPADNIENLKILHGSCRNNDAPFEDALSWVDDFIKENKDDPTKRPQQLFLSGDQVYADSVVGTLLNELGQWGQALLNNKETLPTEWKVPTTGKDRWPADFQHFPPFIRDRLIDSESRFTTGDKSNHLISFGEFAAMYLSVWSNVMWETGNLQNFEEVFHTIQALPENYGAIFRRNLNDERSGVEIEITVGNTVKKIKAADLFTDARMQIMLTFLLQTLGKPALKALLTGKGSLQELNDAKQALNNFFSQLPNEDEKAIHQLLLEYFKEFIGAKYREEEIYEKQEANMLTMHQTLPKVRRALANISTYMIFDDHEITDDWNLNPSWRRRVFTSPLGKSIVRNGMTSYALFQDWGNRADKYNRTGDFFDLTDLSLVNEFNLENFTPVLQTAFQNNGKGVTLDPARVTVKVLADKEWLVEDLDGKEEFLVRKYTINEQDVLKVLRNPHAFLLSQVPRLFTETGATLEAAEDTIDFLLGLDIHHEVKQASGGRYQAPANRSPLVKWHFAYQGAKHRVLAIDNRTRRSFVSFAGAPGNLSFDGMSDLIPENPQPAEDEVCFVIAPLPVLGPSALDELVAPMAYKTFDLIGGFKNSESSKIRMIGTNPDAIEAWAFDPVSQEELLKRLAPFQRIVLLSGDVHYASSQKLHYWRKGIAQPACFAQFTSSGMRNIMPSYIRYISQHFGFAQKKIRRDLRAERLGWFQKEPKPLTFPQDVKPSAFLKHHLDNSPVIIPTLGWPAGTTIASGRDPDWSWRVHNIRDERKESDLDKSIRLEPIEGNAPEKTMNALRAVAARHIKQAKKVNYTRQILFKANIGLVTFEKPDGKLHVVHNLYAVPDDAKKGKIQEQKLFALHKAALAAAETDLPPSLHHKNPSTNG